MKLDVVCPPAGLAPAAESRMSLSDFSNKAVKALGNTRGCEFFVVSMRAFVLKAPKILLSSMTQNGPSSR